MGQGLSYGNSGHWDGCSLAWVLDPLLQIVRTKKVGGNCDHRTII
jgi:hypothetical protein